METNQLSEEELIALTKKPGKQDDLSGSLIARIPKIIHQIAPSDQALWHPLWEKCQESWLELAKESGYEYKLWNDKEDLELLVKEHYMPFYETFMALPKHIMKIDFARFCILHQYGGIYADMDMFCYRDFYDTFYENLNTPYVLLLNAPWGEIPIENALMASIKGAGFWMNCMKETRERVKTLENIKDFESRESHQAVVNTAGPGLVYDVYSRNKRLIYILNGEVFNNHGLSYNEEFFTKHVMTGLWGDEAIEQIKKLNIPYKEALKELWTLDVQKYTDEPIDFDSFDFYRDYTSGKYLKRNE